MIITQSTYDPGDDPPGVPLIGYDNQIIAVTTTTEADDHPATNLLNSATHLFWQSGSTAEEILTISTDPATINYVAIAKHNLADTSRKVAIATSANAESLTMLLHFDAADATTQFKDSSGNDIGFEAVGNAQIDTAQSKFGGSSALFDGAGDAVRTTGFYVAFGTADFTVDCWIRLNAVGITSNIFDARDADPQAAFNLAIDTANHLRYRVSGVMVITGTTALTTGVWNHVAVTRLSGSTRMFLNGVQEGSTFVDATNYLAGSVARIGLSFALVNGFNGWIDEFRVLFGTAAWSGTFTPETAAYADGPTTITGDYDLLLNFNGTDASTTITDEGGHDHVFTAQSGAQLDTAQFKFGVSSLLLDGVNDFLQGDGDDDFAFGTGDFTIDFWFRLNSTVNQQYLYDGRPTGTAGFYITIHKFTDQKLYFHTNGANVISGSTVLTAGAWNHLALCRLAGATRLFLNGVQEGATYTDTNAYDIGASRPVMGVNGQTSGQFFNGWIDQVRVIRGTGLFFTTFVPPSYPINALSPGRGDLVVTDAPIIFRFTPTTDFLSLMIGGGTDVAEIAVIYAGNLLVLERGVKADTQHRDIVHARKSSLLAGMSESGNFLGRVLLSEWRESTAEFAWFTPSWYRANFEPFVSSAVTEPFFWAWNPDEYPEETAFAWLIEDIQPETDPATRRMAATISMRAIV